MNFIGTAELVDERVVSYWIRAEGDGAIGDAQDTVPLHTFEALGFELDKPLENVGDTARVLPRPTVDEATAEVDAATDALDALGPDEEEDDE